jgi:sugar O-acyltransferase (sialic acid O-acetyltransferase NeuD family)
MAWFREGIFFFFCNKIFIMIREIAIYGAGGLGSEMALQIEQHNEKNLQWKLIGYFDDHRQAENVDGIPLLGGIHQLNAKANPLALLLAIADPVVRFRIFKSINNPNVNFPVFVHPSSHPGSRSNKIERGTILTAGSILTTGVTLGEFVFINLHTTIGHNVRIGNFTSLMPSVNISGNVTIGEGVLIGTGATVLQGLSIGDHAVIGAGAVVTKSVVAGKKVVGIPAREV